MYKVIKISGYHSNSESITTEVNAAVAEGYVILHTAASESYLFIFMEKQ